MMTLQLGLSRLPEWFNEQTFPHLMYLDLSHNELRNLPLSLAAMPELRRVIAQHNPRLTAHWTPHANSDDPAALFRYLKKYAAGESEQQRHVRVMLLGLPLVGKSALLECLKHAPGAVKQKGLLNTIWHLVSTPPPGTLFCKACHHVLLR